MSDEFGIFKAVINIIDCDRALIAEWPPARLDVWLDIIRENDDVITADNLFDCVDIEWEENYEDPDPTSMDPTHNAASGTGTPTTTTNPTANDSLNSSRISLNLNAMKEAILGKSVDDKFRTIRNIFSGGSPKSVARKSPAADMLKSALANNNEVLKKRLLYEDDEVQNKSAPPKQMRQQPSSPGLIAAAAQTRHRRFQMTAQSCLKEIRNNTNKLKTLCEDFVSDENVREDIRTNNNEQQQQRIPDDTALHILEQMEQLTSDLRHAIFADPTTATSRTPKSVRFLLD